MGQKARAARYASLGLKIEPPIAPQKTEPKQPLQASRTVRDTRSEEYDVVMKHIRRGITDARKF